MPCKGVGEAGDAMQRKYGRGKVHMEAEWQGGGRDSGVRGNGADDFVYEFGATGYLGSKLVRLPDRHRGRIKYCL